MSKKKHKNKSHQPVRTDAPSVQDAPITEAQVVDASEMKPFPEVQASEPDISAEESADIPESQPISEVHAEPADVEMSQSDEALSAEAEPVEQVSQSVDEPVEAVADDVQSLPEQTEQAPQDEQAEVPQVAAEPLEPQPEVATAEAQTSVQEEAAQAQPTESGEIEQVPEVEPEDDSAEQPQENTVEQPDSQENVEPTDETQGEDSTHGEGQQPEGENEQTDGERTEGEDAQGELTEEERRKAEEEQRKKEEAQRKKEERKAKTRAWFKKHKLLVIILSLVIVLGAGLTVGHFVTTRNVAFIHKTEDLEKALTNSKKTEYIFKNDIVYDGDLTIGAVDIDMNKHTLLVKGNLNLVGEGFIGYKKTFFSKPQAGGEVIVEGTYTQTYTADPIVERVWYSKLSAAAVDVTGMLQVSGTMETASLVASLALEVTGTLNADSIKIGLDENQSQLYLYVSGKVEGPITMVGSGNAEIDGTIDSLTGATSVTVKGTAESVVDAQDLYLYPQSNVAGFVNVKRYYFVQQLDAPTVLVKEVDGTQHLLISQVPNAEAYTIEVDGQQYAANVGTGDYTEYALPNLAPGNYTVKVTATSTTHSEYLDSDSTSISVSYYVTLATPVIAVEESVNEEGGKQVVLSIQHVDNAKSFVVHVGGKDYKIDAKDDVTTYDLTKYVNSVGKYDVYVYATPAKKSNYKDSAKAMVTYQCTQAATVSVATTVFDTGVTATISGENAYYYKVEWLLADSVVRTDYVRAAEGDTTVTTALTTEEIDAVRITALAKGYYEGGAVATASVGAASSEDATPEIGE